MRRLFALAALASVIACGEQAPSNRGLQALLRIDGAQFYPGPIPLESGGPEVVSMNLPSFQIQAGSRDHPVTGALEPDATSAILALAHDVGYWVVTAKAPDVASPEYPTFDAMMEFSSRLTPGDYQLRVQASDAQGRLGKARTQTLHAMPAGAPSGTLVVQLSWDTEADLDLHVVTPDDVEIFARNPNSVEPPPPGKPVDPNAWQMGGILDLDSNAECVSDGRRRENVFWTVPPPRGSYTVRVDTFSLCSAPAARWRVTVVLDGRIIARAEGASGPTDAEGPHDRGAGVLALTFDVP
jgi:hypothetical protein